MPLARLAIISLILFETLNLFGVLHFTLDFSWLGLIITSTVSLIALEVIYYLKRSDLPPTLPYLLAAIGLWIDALGDMAHMYGKYAWYDQFAHLFGGAVLMSLAILLLMSLLEKGGIPILLALFICLSFASFAGNFYEIEEHLEDRFYHGRQVRLGDGPDTVDDIILNTLGGIAVGLIYFIARKKV